MPKISVIIPVYNCEKYIAETLDSVIAQTFADWEAICVNDGSTDDSLKILKQYAKLDKRINIIDQKNQGVVVARNNAIKTAKSDLIYPLDGDDIIKPDCLEKLYKKITNSNYRVVMSNAETFGKINVFFKQPKLNKLHMYGWHESCIISALFYKSDFLKFGGYCEDFNGYGGDDMDYWLNYIDNNLPMIRLDDVLFLYRIKEDKESAWKSYEKQEFVHRHKYKEQKLIERHPNIKRWSILYRVCRKICRFFFRIQDNKIKIFKIPVYIIKEKKMKDKIKIAFIKYDGMGAGGTEKWLQNLAVSLNKNIFDVDYFYTGNENTDRLNFMKSNHINVIKIHSDGKESPYGKWVNTDLFDKFNEENYDIIQNAVAGEKEWPFYSFKKPVVESVHLDYGVNFSPNVYHTFLLSKWNQNKWSKMGGIKPMSSVVPLGMTMPETIGDLREELNIPKDAVVSGFHQRVDDNIFSPIPIYAYKKNEAEKHYFIIMGGSKKYTELAKKLKLKNFIQLEHSANKERLEKFLNTIDIFAHGRRDGETLGYVIIEALLHSKPCIVHKAISNAQQETIGPGGFFCENQDEYNEKLKLLLTDEILRKSLSEKGFYYAKKTFIDTDYVKNIENIYTDIVNHPIKNKIRVKFYNLIRNITHPYRKEKLDKQKNYYLFGIKIKTRKIK